MKIEWDSTLPEDLCNQWIMFYRNMSNLKEFSIPCCVVINHSTEIQLHGFSDASQESYGACVYVRSINTQGYFSSSLLASMFRVAPMSQSTIPRLELSGAALLVELVNGVFTEFNRIYTNISQEHVIILWTDSTIVLAWLG